MSKKSKKLCLTVSQFMLIIPPSHGCSIYEEGFSELSAYTTALCQGFTLDVMKEGLALQ
jgi:hypothetical protein